MPGRAPRPAAPASAPPEDSDGGGAGRRGGSGPGASVGSGTRGGSARTREPASWSDAPPPPDTAPSWASPLEQARAAVAVEDQAEVVAAEHVVDDTAISDDDESIDDLTDVGVPVVERILGGTIIAEDPR